jgi:hypothetical protein
VTQDGGSKYSPSEARFAALIAARVVEVGVSAGEVGVITLYKAQERAIINNLAGILSREGVKEVCEEDDVGGEDDGAVKVSTVDAFQGQEKDVIILSLCGAHGGSGFVTPERINVALTRARRHLIVLGDSRAPGMNKHPAWGSCLKISRTSPNGYKPSFTVDGELRDWLDGWSGADLTMRQSPDPHGSPVDEHERIVLDESIEDLSTPPSRKAEREDAVELDDDVVELDEAPPVDLDACPPVELDAPSSPVELDAPSPAVELDAPSPPVELDTSPPPGSPHETESPGVDDWTKDPMPEPLSPDLDVATLPEGRLEIHAALAKVGFTPEDYWHAYKDIHKGALYRDEDSRRRVETSKLAPVVVEFFGTSTGTAAPFEWRKTSCQHALIRDLIPACETYIHESAGWRWTRLSKLIEHFDDHAALEAEAGGFGHIVVSDARTQAEDEAGAAHFATTGIAADAVFRNKKNRFARDMWDSDSDSDP